MLCGEIVAVCSEIRMYTVWAERGTSGVKTVSTQSNHQKFMFRCDVRSALRGLYILLGVASSVGNSNIPMNEECLK